MKKPKFITKLDDDTEFDYEQLESALGKELKEEPSLATKKMPPTYGPSCPKSFAIKQFLVVGNYLL